MEHEVFVPVPADRLRAALSDPGRVARAVPGLQQEAGAAPVAGRLKVRVAGHSITYRGALRVAERDDGSCTVEGDGTEVRGSGSVKLRLTVRFLAAEGGTTLAFTGTATADGRVADLPPDAVSTAVARLLNRSAENLAKVSDEDAAQQVQQVRQERQEQPGTGASAGTEPMSVPDDDAEVPQPSPAPDAETGPAPGGLAASGPAPDDFAAGGLAGPPEEP
ncbi:SRPBCC family protein, partial [Streptomyces sp. CRN 30]|uniref:SRPBCC family protein n=1 Tax=Streptomyces sp. CRN 30 TaxID=3075613 RepID=UPI002A81B4CB